MSGAAGLHSRKASGPAPSDLKMHGLSGRASSLRKPWVQALIALLLLALAVHFGRTFLFVDHEAEQTSYRAVGPVLVSYSYFEKDAIQLANFEFFQAVGMGESSTFPTPQSTDFVVVISGDECTPCKPLRQTTQLDKLGSKLPQVSEAWSRPGLTLLQRTENEGMDFAAHNVTLEWLMLKQAASKYRFFIFLNSSVRGPFFPSYMPARWQWTQAYTDRLAGNVRAVASSIVCLPRVDAGGYGPKIESWAFALEPVALRLLLEAGVFNLRTCKLCDDGIVVMGEYGISNVLLQAGYNIATLMSKYRAGVDWSMERHWHCNNNVHPSRHGTYDSISMHPFETVFLKASWHVGEPHLAHYTDWFLAHARGTDNTGGTFDERMYTYAVQPHAQEPKDVEQCFKVTV